MGAAIRDPDEAVRRAVARAAELASELTAQPVGCYLQGGQYLRPLAIIGRRRSDRKWCVWYVSHGPAREHELHSDANVDPLRVAGLADALVADHGHRVFRRILGPC